MRDKERAASRWHHRIDYGSRTEKATFYGTIVGDRQIWPAADLIAAWMHVTALRLFPDSPYAKKHNDTARVQPCREARARAQSAANQLLPAVLA